MADRDYSQSGYGYGDYEDEHDFARSSEPQDQGHLLNEQFGDLPANFAKEAARHQNFPESDNFDDGAYVKGESDESGEDVQQGSNPFSVDAETKQTGVAGVAYVDPHDRPIVGFNPFLNEEAPYEKEEEDVGEEHGDLSQEDNEQYHVGPGGESSGREHGDGREDQEEYDRLEDEDDSYHQRETAPKVERYEDEGLGSRTDEAAEGHSEDEKTEERSEGDLQSPEEFPKGYIHSQDTQSFQQELSDVPGQGENADFEQHEQPDHFDDYSDTQTTGVTYDKGEVYEDGQREEVSNISQQTVAVEDDDLGIVNQGFSDDGDLEAGRVIPEEEEVPDSEVPASAIVDTELYEERREDRAKQTGEEEEEEEREEPAAHEEEKQYDDEEGYSLQHTNGGDFDEEQINPEEGMELTGAVQEEYRQRQEEPEEDDYNNRKEDYREQFRQEEEMEREDYTQETQLKPEAADIYQTSPTKVDFSQINYDDDEEEDADKPNEYFEQGRVKTGEEQTHGHTSADDDYTAQYPDEEAMDHTTSTNRGAISESQGVRDEDESYEQIEENNFSSRFAESDLLSTERSYVDNLSNVTSPETIPQPLPSPPEPKNLSSFDPLAASDSPGPQPVGNVGQHGELFQHGFVADESNTAHFLTAGEVEGETKFGVDGTAITSTSQNNAFLHSDEEEEEEDEEESQHLDQGQTGTTATTETETSVEEKSAEYEAQHGGEHMEGNDNALMSMSMEGSFYDDGGELIGGEDKKNQLENNFFEERSVADQGSLLDRFDPKQESGYAGIQEVIQGDSAVDDYGYQQQDAFGVRGSEVDAEPLIGDEVPPAVEENGIHEDEDKPGGFDSDVDILEAERVPQTQSVQREEVADSFVDHFGVESTANESESSVDSQHLHVQEVESPKDVEDIVSGVEILDISPEKAEEPAASVEETPAAGKEEPSEAAPETAGPEAAAATAVGVAVAAAAAAAAATAATATSKTTTTVKKSSAKAGGKTTTTTTTTKVTKETKPAAGKVTTIKKTEITTATSKTTPRKPAESRPTTATSERKTPAKPTTSPTKPSSATPARSSATALSSTQPLAARKPKEVKPATPDEKKKPTSTTTTPRTPLATHRTPRPQSATATTVSASSTTAASTTTTRTTRTVTSATTRTLTTSAARPKSSPTKLTNGTASLDTKSPAKKPGIDTKTGSARTPIEKREVKATPRVDAGSKSTTPAAAARSPTKTTTTPRTPATPKSAEVRSKVGSMENTTHSPGGGHVRIASKKPDFSNVTSKVGSKDKIDHKPGGGNIRIETKKVKVEARSKVGSLNNATHKPGGGDKKAESQKTSKVEKQGPGSGSEQGAVEVQNGAASEN